MANNKDPKAQINNVNKELGYLEEQILNIADSLSGAVKDAISDIKDEALSINEIFEKNLTKSIRNLARESDSILSNTLKLAQGSAKVSDIQKSQTNLKLKELAITRNIESISRQMRDAKVDEKIINDYIANKQQEITDAVGKQNKLLEDQLTFAKQIQKNIGITGKIVESISKIPILKDFINANEVLSKIQAKAAEEGSNQSKTMITAFKAIGSSIKENLSDPLVQLGFAIKTFKILLDIGFSFSKNTAEISRNLGISTERAHEMNDQLYSMVINSNSLYSTYSDNVKALNELNDAFGTALMFSNKQLATQTKLKEAAGLTAEEASKIAEYEQLTGQSAEKVYNSIGKTNKGVLNQKKITQEVLKISGQLAAQYKNNPNELAKAVTQAQKLGMTLEQTKNISKGLLNFEDSISAELEAELLTGQDLNLERARALALMGDTAGAAAELMKNLGPNGLQRFQKMNVIQQEAYARALGMSADDLANSLVKEQALSKLGGKRRNELEKEIQKLREKGEIEKAAELEKRVLTGETVELAQQHIDAQAKLNKSVQRVKDSLSSMIAGHLGKAVDLVAKITEKISSIPGVSKALGAAGLILGGVALIASIITLSKNIISILTGKGKLGEKNNPSYTNIVNLPKNGSGGGDNKENGGDSGESENESGNSLFKGIGSKFKRIGKAFKKGGVKGGFKSISRMTKSSLKGLKKGLGKGLLKGLGKKIPYIGSLLGAGMEIGEHGLNLESMVRAGLTGAGSFLGGLGGAATGTALGLGTGGAGALAIPALTTGGSVGGGMIGDWLGDKIFGERPEEAEDFILRPGQKPLKFRKDDVIIGGTNVEGTKTSNTNINNDALLKEFQEMKQILNAILHKEGTIMLNGTKMGTAMAVGSYKTQ